MHGSVVALLTLAVGHCTSLTDLVPFPPFGLVTPTCLQVRIMACDALVSFARSLPPFYCDNNSGYLAAGLVIHMDDADSAVQEAAARALEALAQVKPGPVAAEVEKARGRFRAKHYCDRILAACGMGCPS